MTQNVIETSGLSKQFGERQVISEVDLAVPRGCAFGFLGHNGAGKTTLIRLLLGLTRPNAGQIRVLGRKVPEERGDALSRVGSVVEEPHFHAHLTGRENLRLAAACRGPRARSRIPNVLQRVGLSDRADDRVRAYSQGMRQRLGIARCLLADPDLLLLDEPMNGLDPAGITGFRELLHGLVAEGRTIFLSSHQLDEVEKTCREVAVIDNGRLIAQGTVGALSRRAGTQLEISCRPVRTALQLLGQHPAVRDVHEIPDGARASLTNADEIPAITEALVHAGIQICRLQPLRDSLENQFFALTRRDQRS